MDSTFTASRFSRMDIDQDQLRLRREELWRVYEERRRCGLGAKMPRRALAARIGRIDRLMVMIEERRLKQETDLRIDPWAPRLREGMNTSAPR